MSETVGGAPAVGNVLGFSLLFRERRALLRLEGRTLAPGIHLAEYEAEIPGVSFPLQAPISAAVFRHRRCRALVLRLTIDRRAIVEHLARELVGERLGGVRITDVDVALQARPEPNGSARPCVYVGGRRDDGNLLWFCAALQLVPLGRHIGVRASGQWQFGTRPQPDLWQRICERVGGVPRPSGVDIDIDPTRGALVLPLVAAGWKAPDLSDLELRSLELGNGRCTALLSSQSGPLARPVPPDDGRDEDDDQVHAKLASIRQSLAAGQLLSAFEAQAALADLVAHHRPARLASLRWLVETARHQPDPRMRARAVEALRGWLELAPNDDRARRLLVEQLAAAGHSDALVRLTARVRELPQPPRRAAALDLALGSLRVDAEPLQDLLDRMNGDADLAKLRAPALLALARAQANAPDLCQRWLRQACRLMPRADDRADAMVSVAAALIESGQASTATEVLCELAREETSDVPTLEAAAALAEELTDDELTLGLLRRVDVLGGGDGRALKRAVALRAHRAGDTDALDLIRGALEEFDDDPMLLRASAELEDDAGNAEAAAAAFGRLAVHSDDVNETARLTLKQARLLVQSGDQGAAWDATSALLRIAPPDLQASVLKLALGVAPVDELGPLAQRLAATAGDPQARQAIAERLKGAQSSADRETILRAGLPVQDDPRPTLHILAGLAPRSDPEPWRALASACADQNDSEGEAEAGHELAMRLLAQGESDAAALALTRAVRCVPTNTRSRVELGLTLERAGHRGEAAGVWTEVVASAPPPLDIDSRFAERLKPGDLEYRSAEIWRDLGDRNRAVSMFELACERSNGNASQGLEASIAIAELKIELGDKSGATAAAAAVAERTSGELKLHWLRNAAEWSEPADAPAYLQRAAELAPDDRSLADALIQSLESAGKVDALIAQLHARADDRRVPSDARADALRRLIELKVGDRNPLDVARNDAELTQHCDELLRLRPDDVPARLVVFEARVREGDDDATNEHAEKLLAALDASDQRALPAAMRVAEQAILVGRFRKAVAPLQRVLQIEPQHERALELLAQAGEDLGDAEIAHRAYSGLLESNTSTGARARLLLRLARVHQRQGHIGDALRCVATAGDTVEVGSALHLEIAEAWLELARDRRTDPGHEARARAELRRALGPDLPPAELRTEALLHAERLGELEHAIDLLEKGLARRPSHDLLLSALKQLCVGRGEPLRYMDALGRAVESLTPSDGRDRLLIELAVTASDCDDPERALQALNSLSPTAAAAAEILDLRDWAVRRCGREDEELRRVEQRLKAAPSDEAALAWLQRIKGSATATAEHLMALAAEASPPASRELAVTALHVARDKSPVTVVVRAMRKALEAGAIEAITEAWAMAQRAALDAEDEVAIADLVEVGTSTDNEELMANAEALLEAGLGRMPAAPHLARTLWDRAAADGDESGTVARALARVEQIADAALLDPRAVAMLYIGVSDQLERREAALLLREKAEEAATEPQANAALCAALQDGGHYPELLAVLELRATTATETRDRVAALKHLAHVCGDTLGDTAAAVGHLEAALALSPTDPDLLLPLLDHCYARSDLSRAVDLSGRVLDHVSMGDAAYVALAHRAADAALALAQHEDASTLLRRAADRVPGDRRTQDRLAELEVMRGDPEHRVQLLATIANRQSGRARIEALEERARLLVEPLERPDEAIVDLEALLSEDPERAESWARLRDLYKQRERWAELVALLEREFPRQHGIGRCELLREMAHTYRDHLLDHPRAEQALRLALEHIGNDPEHADVAEEMRAELVVELQSQGRYVDLSIYLENAMRPELEGQVDRNTLHSGRGALLTELARIYRGPLDDESRAARVYERLEQLGCLPDEGMATLARAYHRGGRHADLVRILNVRSNALAAAGELERKATTDLRIAELLEGPLGRPHEAASYYLDAYLTNPSVNVLAGARARVLFSGTDAVINVRRRLLERLSDLPHGKRPALLTLLGDLLGPHEDYESEAEGRYREALAIDPEHAAAREALGRLLARQGRLADAVEPLIEASRHPEIEPTRAAEDAAIAARALGELQRADEAERVLKDALRRAPDSQRALLELARLYERSGRSTEQAIVLDNLAQLPLSSMLGAEVAYRRAMLLRIAFEDDPYSPEAERARAYLLEAVSADAKHVAARQILLELASLRLEWTIVAHMHYLAIRELAPGPARALVHLDLAETYLDHLDDVESATRNIESAIQQAPGDLVVGSRAGKLALRLPDPRKVADRFERIGGTPGDLADAARARLWLLAADLRMRDDDPAAAEAASRQVLDLPEPPADATAEAERNLEALAVDDARDLRQQKSGLMRLLEKEEHAAERLAILGRLREIGRSLGDSDFVEWASREQIELASEIETNEAELDAASDALRDVLVDRGSFEEIVELYTRLAAITVDRTRSSTALVEAARFCWHGLRDPTRAVSMLQQAIARTPDLQAALRMIGEVTGALDDPKLEVAVYEQLQRITPANRPPTLDLQLAGLARKIGRYQDSIAMLRPLCVQATESDIRFPALRMLDEVLSRIGTPGDRLPILRRYFEEAKKRNADNAAAIGVELSRTEWALGEAEAALHICETALADDPSHEELLRLRAELLEARESWGEAAAALERLAAATVDPSERSELLTDAAKLRLEHAPTDDPAAASRTRAEARTRLAQACELTPVAPGPRRVLLPIAFEEEHWDEVLELALDLRESSTEDEPELILGALAEGYHLGRRSLARDIGARHGEKELARFLLPGLQRALGIVATRGPLPRLDTVLAAAAIIAGGRRELWSSLRSWAAGRPTEAGIALGLGRLYEAEGYAERARAHYQLAAFLAPDGRVPSLVARLPLAVPPQDLEVAGTGPMEGRSGLRVVLSRVRGHLAGFGDPELVSEPPPNSAVRTRLALAETIVSPWRRHLDLALPVAWTSRAIRGGVGVHNAEKLTLTIGSEVTTLSVAELRYRLAAATGTIAMGLAILTHSDTADLADLLDGLAQLPNPSHVPTTEPARAIADRLAARGAREALPTPEERAELADELAHWLTTGDGLKRLTTQLHRSCSLLAVRLSGQLDGALIALANEQGLVRDRRPDAAATLRTEPAQWLLRALELY